MSIKRNQVGKWVIDFTCKGKRITRVIGESKREAEAALAAMKSDILREKYGLGRASRQEVLFETHAKEYLELCSRQSKKSWKSDELSVASLNRFFKGETLPSITPEKVERYRAARKVEAAKNSKAGTPISPATCNRELAALKTLLSKAVEWGRIEVNPAARVKLLKEPPGRERILTEGEAKKLLEVASAEFRPVIITALGTGARRGEILNLKWADLDFVMGVITIVNSKSGRSRKIPMSGAVASALGAVPKHGEYVFWNPETKTRIKDIKTAWAATCARAKKNPDNEKDPGITGVRFHDLRHTALTWMLQGGADIMSVSKIAGHASIVMTQRYCHASPESMRRAVEKLGEFMEKSREKVETLPKTELTGHFVSN